jgi:prepilin signal peptidase PulO-like enzyme (type II secretory pathway)
MERLVELAVAAAVNAVLLVIAASEFRRHRVGIKLHSFDFIIVLCMWTLAEIAVYNRGYTDLAYAALMGSIGVSVVTDKAAGYVLDVVTFPSCAFAIVTSAYRGHAIDSLIDAVAVSGALLCLHAVTRGQGLGLGDVKLAAASGILLGAEAGLVALGIAFVFGGCAAVLLILFGRAHRKSAVPFAPYVAAGALTVLALSPP